MTLLVVALAPGLLVGWAVGGRLSRLADLEVRAPAVIFAAAALQLGLGVLPAASRPSVLVVSSLLVGGWLGLNARRRTPVIGAAIGLLAVGWLLNVAVMVPNGGMPVSSVAMEKLGASPDVDVTDGTLFKHVPADGDTVLPWLGDVVPVAPLDAAVSVGDLVMAVGGTLLVAAGMAGRRAPQLVTA